MMTVKELVEFYQRTTGAAHNVDLQASSILVIPRNERRVSLQAWNTTGTFFWFCYGGQAVANECGSAAAETQFLDLNLSDHGALVFGPYFALQGAANQRCYWQETVAP